MKPLISSRLFWRGLAGCLIVGALVLHVAYFLFDCPLDLAPDEAHYWDWSRHLDWSYYSKGPLVAYLIRAGTGLAGPWSRAWAGSEMPAVRLPAVICGSLLLISLYVLTVQVFGREKVAAAVVAAALTLPIMAVGGSLMTIDAPYTCCWGWALVLGYEAAVKGRGWAWPAAGLMVGLGILAKYTMVLWIPSLALFLLASGRRRRQLIQPGFWVMTAVAAACCAPIVVWNARHDWVSLLHVGGQAGLRDAADGIRWQGPLAYIGMQFLVLVGFWFVAWLAAMISQRPGKAADAGVNYLWWLSAPMFGVFLLFSFKTKEEPNWPVTAYLSGLVLTVGWLARQIQDPRTWYRRLTIGSLGVAIAIGLTLTLFMHHSEWLQPALLGLARESTPARPMPLRAVDPTCRLRGWRTLAESVDAMRRELRAEGIEAEVAGTAWTLPGELAFYCQGQPTVYSLGLATGDRHSQYDLWRPHPVLDPFQFIGRTFVVVGDINPAIRDAFRQVDRSRLVTHYQNNQLIASWAVTVCRDFRGFQKGVEVADTRY